METPAVQPTQKKDISQTQFLIGVALLVCLVLGVAGFGVNYYYNGPCGVRKVEAASKQFGEQASKFYDGLTLAQSTPRIALAGPLADLQQIRRDTNKIETPKCMETTRNLMVDAMDQAINGLIAFMGQADDHTVRVYFQRSDNTMLQATDEIIRVRKCAPFCRTK